MLIRLAIFSQGCPYYNFMNNSICLITLDSLRYDVTQIANTPNLRNIIGRYSENKDWVEVGAAATYTMPAHVSIFQGGTLPNRLDGSRVDFREQMMFFAHGRMRGEIGYRYELPEASNMIKGFGKLGYRTIGVGGVRWFDTSLATSRIWNNYFEEFYWREEFRPTFPDAFEKQIKLIQGLMMTGQVFLFLNVGSTHFPYRDKPSTVNSQVECLEYIDSHIMDVINAVPKPADVILMSDHGECFGEDGLWGHAIYHPKVMRTPLAILEIT